MVQQKLFCCGGSCGQELWGLRSQPGCCKSTPPSEGSVGFYDLPQPAVALRKGNYAPKNRRKRKAKRRIRQSLDTNHKISL